MKKTTQLEEGRLSVALKMYESSKSLSECKSVQDVFENQNNLPAIIQLNKAGEKGEMIVFSSIAKYLNFLCEMANARRTLSPEAIKFIHEKILEKYPYFKIADIKLFVENAVMGKYGKDYDNLSASKVFEWLEIYASDRSSEWANIRQRSEVKSQKNEEENYSPGGFERMAKIFKAAHEKSKNKLKAKAAAEKKDSFPLGARNFCKYHKLDYLKFKEEMIDRYEKLTGNVNIPFDQYEFEFNRFVIDYMNDQNRKMMKGLEMEEE